MKIVRIILLVLIVVPVMIIANSSSTQADKLDQFLSNFNRQEAVVIQSLTIGQGKQALVCYDHIGNEDKHQQLQHRPILMPADPLGPFVKANSFTLLVDRTQPLTLTMTLRSATRTAAADQSAAAGQPILTAINRLVYWLEPLDKRDEERYLDLQNGQFELTLTDLTFISQVVFDIRLPRARHQLTFHLINRLKPVTILPTKTR